MTSPGCVTCVASRDSNCLKKRLGKLFEKEFQTFFKNSHENALDNMICGSPARLMSACFCHTKRTRQRKGSASKTVFGPSNGIRVELSGDQDHVREC